MVQWQESNPLFSHFEILASSKNSVWPGGKIIFPIFDRLQQWKFATDEMFAKVGEQLCQILNTKPSKDCQRVLKYWQSGEILANLVTLSKMKIRVLKFSCRSFKISSGHTHTRLYTTYSHRQTDGKQCVTRLGDLLDFKQLWQQLICPNLPHS